MQGTGRYHAGVQGKGGSCALPHIKCMFSGILCKVGACTLYKVCVCVFCCERRLAHNTKLRFVATLDKIHRPFLIVHGSTACHLVEDL